MSVLDEGSIARILMANTYACATVLCSKYMKVMETLGGNRRIWSIVLLVIMLGVATIDTCSAQGISGSWETASSAGFIAASGSVTIDFDNKLYTISGGALELDSGSLTLLPIVQVFDPQSGVWVSLQTTGTLTPRMNFTANLIGNSIYVIGGFGATDATNIEVLDLLTNTWSSPSVSGTFIRRTGATSCVIDNKIYVFGGIDISTSKPTPSVEIFDPELNTWSQVSTTGEFTARTNSGAVLYGGKVIVFGGSDSAHFTNVAESFDPATNAWSQYGYNGLFTPRHSFTSTLIGNKLYVIGGWITDRDNQVEVLDLSKSTWETPALSGVFTQRYDLSSGLIGNTIYVVGGTGHGGSMKLNESLAPQDMNVSERTPTRSIAVYPNPASADAHIAFVVANDAFVLIKLYNPMGTELTVLARHLGAQNYSISLPIEQLPSGTYTCSVQIGSTIERIPFVVLK